MATILIVEDSPANMMLFSLVLESAGHTLLSAERAQAGIELAREHVPDLVLMDIQLPGMDGLAALAHLRADPRTRAIPVVALTAYAMKGDRENLLAAGFDAYIEKPIDYVSFLEQVAALAIQTDREQP